MRWVPRSLGAPGLTPTVAAVTCTAPSAYLTCEHLWVVAVTQVTKEKRGMEEVSALRRCLEPYNPLKRQTSDHAPMGRASPIAHPKKGSHGDEPIMGTKPALVATTSFTAG